MDENPYRSPVTTSQTPVLVHYRPLWEVALRAGILTWLSLFGCFVAAIAIFPWVFGWHLIPPDLISLAISALAAVIVSGLLAALSAAVAAVLQWFNNNDRIPKGKPDRDDRP